MFLLYLSVAFFFRKSTQEIHFSALEHNNCITSDEKATNTLYNID